MPRLPAIYLTWYIRTRLNRSVVHSPLSVFRDRRYGNVFTCVNCSFWMSMRHAMSPLPWSCRYWWVGCICICLSVRHSLVLCQDDWMDGSGFQHTMYTVGLSYTVFYGNSGVFKNNGTFIGNFVTNSKLGRFLLLLRYVMSTVVASAVNLGQPLHVYHVARRPLLFATRWPWRTASRGSSATAESCMLKRV